LKDELLNDKIHRITNEVFDTLIKKAEQQRITRYVKHFKGYGPCAEIKEGSLLSVSHIISIMIYCNFTV